MATKNVVTQGTKTAAGTVNYNPNTGAKLSAGQSVNVNSGGNTYGSNPVSSSTPVRADNYALGADISGLQRAYAAEAAQIQAQQAALAERRANEVAGIKTEFDIAKAQQEVGQVRDYGARSTSLITSGGGFLGATQSQEGVLQNLKSTFEAEKTALMSKREAAINAANQAYEDKDFALARELTKNAKDLQNEIYGRQKDYAEQSLAISRENRAQTEFDMGITDKKVKAYSLLSDEQFANLDPNEIAQLDAKYYSGYTDNLRRETKKEVSSQLATLASKYPSAGITSTDSFDEAQVKIRNSQEYKMDMQKAEADIRNTNSLITERASQKVSAGTEGERKLQAISSISQKIVPGATLPNGDTILNPDGGYINPKAWKDMINHAPELGLDRGTFIQNFGHYLLIDPKTKKPSTTYGLTPKELKDLGYE